MQKAILSLLLCLIVSSAIAENEGDTLRHYHISEVTIATSRTNAKLKDLPQKIEVIDQAVISMSPATNVADLLKSVTNLDIIQYPGVSSSFGMRGFSPSAHSRSYTLILINGVPSATTNAAAIPMAAIDRIEVVKGPLSALYGSDAMGGVINIITKEAGGDRANGQVSLTAGTFGTKRIAGDVSAPLTSATSFRMGFSKNEQNSNYRIGRRNILSQPELSELILDKKSFGDVMLNSKYTTHDFTGQINTRINDTWKTSLDVIYFGADDIETPGNYWGSYGQSKKDINRLNLTGKVSANYERHKLSLNPYFGSQNTRNYSNNSETGYVSLDSDIREFGMRIHDNIGLGFMNLLVGADVDVYEYRSDRFSGKGTPANPYQPDYNHRKIAGLVQASRTISQLQLNAGARFDQISYELLANEMLNSEKGSETYNTFNPSVGIKYNLPLNFAIKASYGTGFSVPDAFKVAGNYSVSEYFPAWDFWWVKNYEGNPDLKPEKSNTMDLGLSFTSSNRFFNGDITWFKTRHNDKIVEYTFKRNNDLGEEITITSYKNADKSNHEGIELMGSANFGTLFDNRFKLELYSNFTFMLDYTFDETKADVTTTYDMLYVRKSNGSFGILFDNYNGFQTRINGRYIGNRLEKDSFSALRPNITADHYYTKGGYEAKDKILQLPNHIVFDWSVYYTYAGNKRFGIGVSNLLDENYSEKDGYNMPGRVVTGSFSFLF